MPPKKNQFATVTPLMRAPFAYKTIILANGGDMHTPEWELLLRELELLLRKESAISKYGLTKKAHTGIRGDGFGGCSGFGKSET